MNMISEQIKELRNYERIFNGDRIDGNLSPIFGNAANTIEELSEKLKNGGWIPCSERLPKKSGEYIVMISGAELPTCLNFLSSDNSWFDTEKDYEVLYWQPLPEAYHG